MNIILGEENVADIDGRYTVLELDTFRLKDGNEVKSYCLVENLSLDEMMTLDRYVALHESLIRNYKKQDWNFCEQALEHLRGRWNQELDTFYDSLQQRVEQYKTTDLGPSWDAVVDRG